MIAIWREESDYEPMRTHNARQRARSWAGRSKLGAGHVACHKRRTAKGPAQTTVGTTEWAVNLHSGTSKIFHELSLQEQVGVMGPRNGEKKKIDQLMKCFVLDEKQLKLDSEGKASN